MSGNYEQVLHKTEILCAVLLGLLIVLAITV